MRRRFLDLLRAHGETEATNHVPAAHGGSIAAAE
jgi:hypothetical protein